MLRSRSAGTDSGAPIARRPAQAAIATPPGDHARTAIRVLRFHGPELVAIVEAKRDGASGAVKRLGQRRCAPDDAPRGLCAGAELARRNFYSHTARHYATASREFAKLLRQRQRKYDRHRAAQWLCLSGPPYDDRTNSRDARSVEADRHRRDDRNGTAKRSSARGQGGLRRMETARSKLE